VALMGATSTMNVPGAGRCHRGPSLKSGRRAAEDPSCVLILPAGLSAPPAFSAGQTKTRSEPLPLRAHD